MTVDDEEFLQAALPGYELGDEIGRGGWGIVYRARQRSLGRTVAIKQLPGSTERAELERFMEEARVVSRLDHPHVVAVYDFIEFEGHGFIIMEYVSGGSVWSQFSSGGLHSDDSCVIGLAVASALHAAHRQRVIHRDVKPDNVLLTQSGEVRLTDFGNLAGIGFGRAHTNDLIGTPAYMSPEQVTGDPLTPASDVYCLGLMMHELLSGFLPFEPTVDREVLYDQRFNQQPAPLPEFVPPVMRQVLAQTLQRDPADRFASAESFGVQFADAANQWFGSDWIRHARGDLLDTSRIGTATRVSGMTPPSGRAQLVVAGVAEHARTGTLFEATVSPDDIQQPQRPAASTEHSNPGATADLGTDEPAYAEQAPPQQPSPHQAPPDQPSPERPDPIPTLGDPMTDNPGPPPGAPGPEPASPGPPPGTPGAPPGMPGTEPEVTPEPRSSKPKKWLVALLLGGGALFLLVILGVVALLLAGGSSASDAYCQASEDLNTQLGANDGNLDQLRFIVDQGGQEAPGDIVDEWIALDRALVDLGDAATPEARADAGNRADNSADAIYDYSLDNCG